MKVDGDVSLADKIRPEIGVACDSCWIAQDSGGTVFLVKRILPFVLVAGFALLLCLCSGSWLIARKVVALLILPAGALWLAGLLAISWPGLKIRGRLLLVGGWLVYSLAGSPYVGIALLRGLEEKYYGYEQSSTKFDALVLLGGGTVRSPGGNPALGTHGDRILRPAMLYHEGRTKVLVTTGRSVTEKGADRLLSRETSEIWQDLAVPAEVIVEIPEPRNTSEELAAVAELVKQHPEWKMIGLCSSASHLDRALGEARKQGLECEPVPSDFRSTPLVLSPLYLVPQGRGFRDVQTALWEFLGKLL